MKRIVILAFIMALLSGPSAAEEPRPTPEQLRFFETKVRPILADNCYRCHGPKKQSNGLRLDSRAALRAGGDSGPAIVPGEPAKSLLIRAINHEGPEMPPKTMLKPEQIANLTAWVKMGAPWPADAPVTGSRGKITDEDRKFWAFQALTDPPLPQ